MNTVYEHKQALSSFGEMYAKKRFTLSSKYLRSHFQTIASAASKAILLYCSQSDRMPEYHVNPVSEVKNIVI